MTPTPVSVADEVDQVARQSYGRLIAILAKMTGDVAAAEDALADAFARALAAWGETGVPENPESWLITVARNRERDRLRSSAHRTTLAGEALETMERRSDVAIVETMDTLNPDALPDERLKLMLVCAHPAIAEATRTPLMLQTVLGLEASTIATAFAIPSATMAQRLVRAKAKIKQARIPFALPEANVLNDRMDAVLEAIYGAYAAQWQQADDAGNEEARDLCREALFLADLLVDLMPDHAEALGLAALLWFIHARTAERQSEDGAFIPLEQQDPERWNPMALARAYALLQRAAAKKQMGRYQLEAAIQSVHAARREVGFTNWQAIAQLYEGLNALYPTLGSAVARAAALGEAYGPGAGLNALAAIAPEDTRAFQPAWAVKAKLLARQGDYHGAASAYKEAIKLCTHAPQRAYLRGKLEAL